MNCIVTLSPSSGYYNLLRISLKIYVSNFCNLEVFRLAIKQVSRWSFQLENLSMESESTHEMALVLAKVKFRISLRSNLCVNASGIPQSSLGNFRIANLNFGQGKENWCDRQRESNPQPQARELGCPSTENWNVHVVDPRKSKNRCGWNPQRILVGIPRKGELMTPSPHLLLANEY